MKIPLDADADVKPPPKRTDTVLEGQSMAQGIAEAEAREGKGERAVQRMNEQLGEALDPSGKKD